MAKVSEKDQHEGDRTVMTAADPTTPSTPASASRRGHHGGRSVASSWVARFLAGVRGDGAVLDLACGGGRHLRLAREHGHPVTGLDRDLAGLADLEGLPGVELIAHDLEAEGGPAFPLADRRFAGVIVTNYLFRPLFPLLRGCVAADGVLIYETFARGQERHGRPSNPEFLLGPNELLAPALIEGLIVVGYEYGEIPADPVTGSMPKIVQRLAAVGPDHPWAMLAPRPIGD
jgi:SAM-dependent methyltransferase